MGKKTDEKILELLRKRVIEKDNELSRKEYHKATKEALMELTSLSEGEVNTIYKDIIKEVHATQKKRKKQLLWVGAVALILLLLFTPRFIEYMRPPIQFVDDFSRNTSNWNFVNESTTSQYIENGEYVMDVYKADNKLEYVWHKVELPKNFSIETDVKKIRGQADVYGIYIGENSANFAYFFIKPSGEFRYGCYVKGKWETKTAWENSEFLHKGDAVSNRLKVVVKGNQFEFFLNDKSVETGELFNLKKEQYAFVVGGRQKIAFDNLTITNTDSQEQLYTNVFEKEEAPWVNNINVLKKAEFKDGHYIITTNVDNYCYWAETWLPEDFKTLKQYEIRLDAHIVQKEKSGIMGFMLMQDTDNHISFEVKDGTQGRITISKNKKSVYVGTYSISTESDSDKIALRILKKGNEIEYYLNGLLVDKINDERWRNWKGIEKMGLKACSFQTVAFDNLEFAEIK